jgi:serine protease inhibitor
VPAGPHLTRSLAWFLFLSACGASPTSTAPTAPAVTAAPNLAARIEPEVPQAASEAPRALSDAGVLATTPAHPDAAPSRVATASFAEAFDPKNPARADRDFALRLYAIQKGQNGNLFFSPASLRLALAMTYAGARGETAAEMSRALGLPADVAAMASSFGATIRRWNTSSDPKVKLVVANRLWGQAGMAFVPDFLDQLRSGFDAPLERLDFAGAPEPSRIRINAFVEAKTQHLIKDLLAQGDIHAATRLVLTNAIYFKGEWRDAFKPSATKVEPFHLAPGEDVPAPLMHRQGTYDYWEGGGVELIALPYGAGDMSMVVLLPNSPFGIDHLQSTLGLAWLERAMHSMRPETVIVTIPRFSVTTRTSFVGPLSELGMRRAFQAGAADFSGIDSAHASKIDDVIQQAFVRVDEKGTEAAAATAVMVALASAPPPPKTFKADHPFVYFMRDEAGNVLFMGRLSNPKE